jgi:predicted flap endonuclease-1-like 5' DNA nuclease
MAEVCGPWLPYIIGALILGFLTAWWIWGGRTKPSAPDMRVNTAGTAPPSEPLAANVETVAKAAAVAAVAGGIAVAAAKPEIAPAKKVPAAKAEPASKPPMSKVKTAPKAKAAAVKTAPVQKPATKPVTLVAVPKPTAKKATAPVKPNVTAKPKAAGPKTVTPKTVTPKAKAAARPVTKPAVKVKAPATPKIVIPDNLELLKGIGPKLNASLKSIGITQFAQVAAWKAADIKEVDAKLGNFAGRVSRDNWVDQAKLLSKGDVVNFEKKYGPLGSEIKRS